MSVYKRTVRGKRARNYSIDYVDENGVRRTVSSGTSDKRLAEQIKRKYVDRARAVREGLVDPRQERLRRESGKPIAAHVKDYVAACRGRGEAATGLTEKERHLDWFVEVAGTSSLNKIRPDEFDLRLSALTEAGSAARTVNLKLECVRSFLNWCVKNGRLDRNPLRVVQRRNEVVDRRRRRRVLSAKEAQALLAVARAQAAGVPGAQLRPLWYLLPLLAGLRRGDMVRLTWGDLDLAAKVPTLTVTGGKAKRRVDVLPLHPDLARDLAAVRPKDALPSARVFPRAVSNATRQEDFTRAGIVLETEDGYYADLHALRHTFGTRLAEKGVPPATLQRLMRHSTVELTMRYYVHLGVDALGAGIAVLPGVEAADSAARAEAG